MLFLGTLEKLAHTAHVIVEIVGDHIMKMEWKGEDGIKACWRMDGLEIL